MKFPFLPFFLVSLFLVGCGNETPSSQSATVELPSLIPEIDVAGVKPKPMGYVKMISMPRLIKKVVSVASAVKPDPQVAMLPMMAGMALGDPALTSIDPDMPTTMVVFEDITFGGLPSFVLAMKLAADSPVKKQVENIGMKTIEVDGWTLATMNPDFFEQVKDWSSVMSFAQEKPQDDIEIGVLMGKFFKNLPKMKTSVIDALTKTPLAPETKSNLGHFIHILLDEFATLEATKIDFSLSAQEIVIRATMSAKKETELFKLLSAEMKPFSLAEAKYISANGWMDMLVNFNSDSLSEYITYLIQKMDKTDYTAQWKEVFSKSLSMIRESNKLYGGQAAMSFGISNIENPMSFVQLLNTQATPEQWNKSTKESIAILQQLFSDSDELKELGFKYDVTIVDDSKVDGVQVYLMNVDTGNDLKTLDYLNTISTYFAVRDGLYMGATSKKQLLNLLNANKNDKSAENNLMEVINLKQGEIISWRLDVVGYAKMIVSMMDNLVSNPLVIFGDVMEDFENLQIPPVTGSSKLGGGRVDAEVRIPLKSIKAGVDYLESVTQNEAQEIK